MPKELATAIFDLETEEDVAFLAGLLWRLMDLEDSMMQAISDQSEARHIYAFTKIISSDNAKNAIGMVPAELWMLVVEQLNDLDCQELRL